eukprot:GCRY01001152.1.p1 GENE.GCRY01001152.1~~GCRY01001152.1.p1  ORF type:complete len:843 (+),score=207.25 GCRY01001152.1:272-2800(+)
MLKFASFFFFFFLSLSSFAFVESVTLEPGDLKSFLTHVASSVSSFQLQAGQYTCREPIIISASGLIVISGVSGSIWNCSLTTLNAPISFSAVVFDGNWLLQEGSSFSATNCTFGSEVSTAAIEAYSSEVHLINTVHHGVSSIGCGYVFNSTFTMSDNFVSGCISDNNGGAFFLDGNTNFLISDTIFEKNVGNYGGALFISESLGSLTRVDFLQNMARKQGGALCARYDSGVAMEYVRFLENTVPAIQNSKTRGGAIFSADTDFTISHSVFRGNTAANFGGALNMRVGSSMAVRNTTFEHNYAGEHGGAIDIYLATLDLKDCLFLNNTSEYGHGGAINLQLLLVGSVSTISDSRFEDNSALLYGGAVAAIDTSAAVRNSVIFNNTSPCGGGIYLKFAEECHFLLENSTVENNTANKDGGGLYSLGCQFQSQNSTFAHNTAQQGGGVYLYASESAFTGSVFADNRASSGGGGFLDLAMGTFDNCSFLANSASNTSKQGGGGGLYLFYSYFTVADSLFSGNVALNPHSSGLIHQNESCAKSSDLMADGNSPPGISGECLPECDVACRYCSGDGRSTASPDFCVCRTPYYVLALDGATCIPESDCGRGYYINTTDPEYMQCAVSYCATDLCSNGGTCENLEDTFYCNCPKAYTGRLCTDDVDGCLASNCSEHATCLDIPAPGVGFSCGPCVDGYEGDGYVCTKKSNAAATALFITLSVVGALCVVGAGTYTVQRIRAIRQADKLTTRARQMTFGPISNGNDESFDFSECAQVEELTGPPACLRQPTVVLGDVEVVSSVVEDAHTAYAITEEYVLDPAASGFTSTEMFNSKVVLDVDIDNLSVEDVK